MLEIPVLLGDLVERRPATEDRRKVHQAVDATDLAPRALDDPIRRVGSAKVDTHRRVAFALELADETVHRVLVEVHGEHARAGRSERAGDRRPDPARGTGDDHAAPIETGSHVPGHGRASARTRSLRYRSTTSSITSIPSPGPVGG